MKKKYLIMLEFVKKEATENGRIGLRESGEFMIEIAKLSEKHGMDCNVHATPSVCQLCDFDPCNCYKPGPTITRM